LRDVFDETIVSSNNEFECEGVAVLGDELGAGPLAGIHAALRHCRSEYLYVTACDMPFVSPAYIGFMRDKLIRENGAARHDACVARREDGFLEPFNAFYGKVCVGPLRAALEEGAYKVQPLLEKLRLSVIPPAEVRRFREDAETDMFFNINYCTDLLAAEKYISEGSR
jgi:molybdopterin-guanine dinucleotide biosynthesis protein A